MAAYTVANAKSATLGAGAADSVTLTNSDIKRLRISLRSGTGPLWVRWNAGTAVVAPVAAADDNYVVVSASVPLDIRLARAVGQGQITVGVLSATADVYTVEGHVDVTARG